MLTRVQLVVNDLFLPCRAVLRHMIGGREMHANESTQSAPAGHAARNDFAALDLGLVVYAVQSPTNIGMILRVAEAYGMAVSIFDPHGVLAEPEKRKTIEDFSCGSLRRRGFALLSRPQDVLAARAGRRLIVTSIVAGGSPLPATEFRSGDLIVLGNEYDGVPPEMLAEADVSLHIPMPDVWMPKPASWYPIDPSKSSVARDGTPNLNVAMSAAIICYAAYNGWLAKGVT
jgi:tRNA G18 (ribose-2'-O)-methylase SpoU